MKIEQKNISSVENLFYFTPSLPIIGTYFVSKDTPPYHPVLKNLQETNLCETILLTADYIYIKATDEAALEDASLLALAEIEEYFSTPKKPQIAPISETEEKIRLILKLIIAPFLQKDGGDIELIEYKDNIVSVHFLGKCQGCPYAKRTLEERVAKNLIRCLPYIKEVVLR